jgi:hypothetical protein
MTYRPDSPLNRLILLWPGVPIGTCALGFSMALYQVGQTHSRGFAALAMAMGFGLALSIGLLFHSFFITWLELGVTEEGLTVRPVGLAWFNAQPRLVRWQELEAAHEVVTRQGGYLRITAAGQVYELDRAIFREETYTELCQAVAGGLQFGGEQGRMGLAAAA